MTFEYLTLIMTFIGGPFILMLVWIGKKYIFNSIEARLEPIETKNGKEILNQIEKLDSIYDGLNDNIIKLEERQESLMREMNSIKISISTVHKRLDTLLTELATHK